MEFKEKAQIRLQHWLSHNEDHVREYRRFADELEAAGLAASGKAVREMTDCVEKGNACLREALHVL
jgi:hypothetical protein